MRNSMMPSILRGSLVLSDFSLLRSLLTALGKADVYLSYCHFSLPQYRISYKYCPRFATFTRPALPPV